MAFERSTEFLGVEYWAIWNTQLKPNYVVLRYIGHDKDIGMHYFESLNRRIIIKKNYNQIDFGIKSSTFKPFVLSTRVVEERLK